MTSCRLSLPKWLIEHTKEQQQLAALALRLLRGAGSTVRLQPELYSSCGWTDGWPLHDHSQPLSSNAEHEGCAGSCPWAAHSPPSRALLFQGQWATDPGNCPAPSQRMDAGQTIPDLRCATLEEPLWMAGTQRPDAAAAEGNRSLSPSSLREILPSLGRPGERMAPGPRYRVPTPGPTSTNATRWSLLYSATASYRSRPKPAHSQRLNYLLIFKIM